MPTESILIVEDERIIARDLQAMLPKVGYTVSGLAATGADAIAKAAALHPDLVLMDVRLQDAMDGIEAATVILAQFDIPVIYLTAFTDEATRQRARQTAPYGYLVKPFDERTVQTTIEMALARHVHDREIRTHQEWLAATLASLSDAVVTTDVHGQIIYVNSAAEQLLRCAQAEVIGAAVTDVVVFLDPSTRTRMQHPVMVALRRHDSVHLMAETILFARDGSECTIAGSVVPIRAAEGDVQGAVLVFQASTEQSAELAQRAQEPQTEENQQIQRLRVLASGIAHNFNNLLTTVLGNAELARFDIPEEHPAHESLAQIAPVVQRATNLTSQLRAYAGDAPTFPVPLDINELVRQTVTSLPSSTLTRAAIRIHLAPDLPLAKADGAQIQLVVLHLLTNAAEAIGEAEGVITITTELRQLGSADLATAIVGADLLPGRYAALQITDNGSGMNEATLARIFDPFFTTKFTGRGLGLPAVLGIIRQHGGAITVESMPGKGTTFTIFLASVPAMC